MTDIGPSPAIYIRRSTDDQSDAHQHDDIKRWLDYNDIAIADCDDYVETASGAASDRNEFRALIDAIEAGEVSDVIVWEISRIARNGLLAQQFFEACEDAGVTIHVTDGAVRRVEPDGHGRLVADIVAAVAAEERRRLIERTQSGQRRARKEGKWLGQVPVGFRRSEEGFLSPILDPDYDAKETGYFDIVEALEAIERGKSYRKTAEATPNVTRQTLSTIDQDNDRRRWYLDREAADDAVDMALSEVRADG
jgi:DNA invertase Pin-like site-specific DNA recombinase